MSTHFAIKVFSAFPVIAAKRLRTRLVHKGDGHTACCVHEPDHTLTLLKLGKLISNTTCKMKYYKTSFLKNLKWANCLKTTIDSSKITGELRNEIKKKDPLCFGF